MCFSNSTISSGSDLVNNTTRPGVDVTRCYSGVCRPRGIIVWDLLDVLGSPSFFKKGRPKSPGASI